MPAYKIYGKSLVYFAGYKNHIGFYATPTGHSKFASELSKYKQGKGSVQFPILNFSVDKEIEKIYIERKFAAPVSNVWSAWTLNEKLDKWWAPKPWKARTKSMDFSEGGFWLYAMIGPEGEEQWARADYISITKEKGFHSLDTFCDSEGIINNEYPQSNWKIRFIESSNSTQVKIELTFHNLSDLERNIDMGFIEGFKMALENLDDLLSRR